MLLQLVGFTLNSEVDDLLLFVDKGIAERKVKP